MIRDVAGEREFSTTNHLQAVIEKSIEGKKLQDDINDAKLEVIVMDLNTLYHCIFLHTKLNGSWLTVWVTVVTGTVLLAMKFRDFWCTHYNVTP